MFYIKLVHHKHFIVHIKQCGINREPEPIQISVNHNLQNGCFGFQNRREMNWAIRIVWLDIIISVDWHLYGIFIYSGENLCSRRKNIVVHSFENG